MSKGENTRAAILEAALRQATELGLEGLTLGKLAEQLGMSKSGVFAHFKSREDLQLAVLDLAGLRFIQRVLQPALTEPRGLPRLRAIASNWFTEHDRNRRACLFLSSSSEYDDRPGPLRDAIAAGHVRWQRDLVRCVEQARDLGQLRRETDSEQLAFEIFSLVLGLHHDARLFRDVAVPARAQRAFDGLLERYTIKQEVT